jgi:hypothetical protein
VLMHKLPKPEIVKSRRAEVVGRVDVTWMDVDPWDVCHVPVGPEGKSRQWGRMASPRVTWTFLSTPRVTTLVGDSCVVGPVARKVEVRKSGVGEGSECESLQDRNPKTPPKFRLENLEI